VQGVPAGETLAVRKSRLPGLVFFASAAGVVHNRRRSNGWAAGCRGRARRPV